MTETTDLKKMNLSDQALGTVMMALQKSLMEQSDIVPTLKEFKFRLSEDGLMVMNPPIVKYDESFEERVIDTSGIDVVGKQPE